MVVSTFALQTHPVTKELAMTVTVRDLIWALKELPADAPVILRGSNETFDGYSHPFIDVDTDGEVVIREADEDEAEVNLGEAMRRMREADSRIE